MEVNKLKTEAVVGQKYIVPTIKLIDWILFLSFKGNFLPVLLPPHNDREVISGSNLHYHIDFRFVSENFFKHYMKNSAERKAIFVFPVEEKELSYKELICRRKQITIKSLISDLFIDWQVFRKIEKLCEKRIMKAMICPHKGTNLNSCEIINDCVQCPMHGLKWDVKSGNLIKNFDFDVK